MIKQSIRRGELTDGMDIFGEVLTINSSNVITPFLDLSNVKHLIIKSNCVVNDLDLPEGLLTLSIGPGVRFDKTIKIPESIVTLAVFDLANWDFLNVPVDLAGIKELYKRKGQAFEMCLNILKEAERNGSAEDQNYTDLKKAFQLLKMVTR